MDTGPRAADRPPAGRILARFDASAGRACRAIDAPAGRPDRAFWAVPGGSLGADRGPLRDAAAPRVADRGPLGGRFGALGPGRGRAGFTRN